MVPPHKLLGDRLDALAADFDAAMSARLGEVEGSIAGKRSELETSIAGQRSELETRLASAGAELGAAQEARFASDSEGLATKPNFGLISFEAINFMDGHRSTAEIADLLSAEYLVDIDQVWVDRLVNILEKQKLVAVSRWQLATSNYPDKRHLVATGLNPI